MCAVDREGLDVEFVVIDNNSTDDTPEVIDSFAERLHLRHLFECRPGKSCAVNHALDTVELGEIVVFTDDDVVPRRDWLTQIAAACERWPEYDVFGGKIELIWPKRAEIPRWATEIVIIRQVGFGEHNVGTEDKPYERYTIPCGSNYWVRSRVLSDGVRLNESLGPPRPGHRFGMGEETEFLRMAAGGSDLLYVPGSIVGHHVQVSLLDSRNMLKRVILHGRGKVHLRGLPDPERLIDSPWRWRMRRIAAITWYLVRFLGGQLHIDECIRMKNAVEVLRGYGYHREALYLSWGRHRRDGSGIASCEDEVP
jgi:hypothetical protein